MTAVCNTFDNHTAYSMEYSEDSADRIIFSDGKTAVSIPIEDDSDYVYKIRKTYISANGGAPGLFKECAKSFSEDFAEVLYIKVIKAALSMHRCRSGLLIRYNVKEV